MTRNLNSRNLNISNQILTSMKRSYPLLMTRTADPSPIESHDPTSVITPMIRHDPSTFVKVSFTKNVITPSVLRGRGPLMTARNSTILIFPQFKLLIFSQIELLIFSHIELTFKLSF